METAQSVKEYFDKLNRNECPVCGEAITLKQVGRCVYAEPCGHRMYQGRLPDSDHVEYARLFDD